MVPIYGVTMGDSSGIGPEIVLKAFAAGEIIVPIVVFGDLEALRFYSRKIDCPVDLRKIEKPGDFGRVPERH